MKLFSNGLKGWKQSWSSDLRASISVAFIAIPLGLGIGLASGVPPLAALIPCVVGGLFISWISGGNLAIHSTPKMMIGVSAAAVATLGGDDLFLGYRLLLSAIVVAGIIQFVLGLLRMGFIGDLIPATVIKSLLASVGVIIILKQYPVLLGAETNITSNLELLKSLPLLLLQLNPVVFFIGLISTVIMFAHSRIEFPVIKAIPAAVWVIIIAISYSYALGFADGGSISFMSQTFSFGSEHLIDLPSEIRQSIVTPNFDMWQTGTFWNIVLAVVLISSIEGILSAKALDRLDPLKRKTNVNKELSAIGIGTSISGLLGGLPVIPGIVATSVGVNHNGKSQLMDLFQALFILLSVVLLSSQLQHIPLAALAGILIHTGYKLVNPREILNIYLVGWDQILIFSVTLLVTLANDLILGIAAGTVLTIVIHIVRLRSLSKLFTILFRPNVVSYQEGDDDSKFHISVKGYSNFLNYPRLKKALEVIPRNASINVDVSLAEFIDHTVMEHLAEYEEDHIRKGGQFEIIGLDTHHTFASHPLSVRFKGKSGAEQPKAKPLTSRQQKLQALATELHWNFDPGIIRFISSLVNFHMFRNRAVDRVYNKLTGIVEGGSIMVKDADFHEGEFHAKVKLQATVAIIGLNNSIPAFTIEQEHLFDRIAALAGYDDIDFKNFKKFSDDFRLKGENEQAVRAFFSNELLEFLENQMPYRIESNETSILVMGKNRIMSETEVRDLIHFCTKLASIITSTAK